jgi:hypothetical protein
MSNVLIGIIGVILFIGLALAGALILGDDFKTATNSSRAAALMAQMKQAADAAVMYKLKTGRAYLPSQDTRMLMTRFLKSEPINPTHYASAAPADFRWRITMNNNIYADAGPEPAFAARYIVAGIGPVGDARSRAICLEISQTYGQADVVDYPNVIDPPQEAGCISVEGVYVAYVRFESSSQSATTQSGY